MTFSLPAALIRWWEQTRSHFSKYCSHSNNPWHNSYLQAFRTFRQLITTSNSRDFQTVFIHKGLIHQLKKITDKFVYLLCSCPTLDRVLSLILLNFIQNL